MKKILTLIIALSSLIATAQEKGIEVGFDISIMQVKPNFYPERNQKLNTRFGGQIGYRVNRYYTIRTGLYNETWHYLYQGIACSTNPLTQEEQCFNRRNDSRMNWWSVPLFNEFYVWKRRLKFIAAPNVLFGKAYKDVSLIGGLGYNWAFSDYGSVHFDFLYQNNKADFFGRAKNKPYHDILMVNVGIQCQL